MSISTIATFNLKNLIEANSEYYKFEKYTDEEYAWKRAWVSEQLVTMNADIVCLQEAFSLASLQDVITEANEIGTALNNAVLPDHTKSYRKKAIFKKLGYSIYDLDNLFFAPNSFDGGPGHRRPGLAIISRHPFEGTPKVYQNLETPMMINFEHIGGGDAGHFELSRLSRPIIKARINIKGVIVTIFNCHLKSKLGEFKRAGLDYPVEANLNNYDPVARAAGELRALLRRAAEALYLRKLIIDELKKGRPVMVLGDLNDSQDSVSAAIIKGERPFKNYAWMRRHDAKNQNERYSDEENTNIRKTIEHVQLISAEQLFVKKSLRDMVYTSAFGGVYESIDQILMSDHFSPDNADHIGTLEYLSIYNDHITDGSHPEAPYNKLASDHGQLVAHILFK